MPEVLGWQEMTIRLLIAAFCGMIIGIEREVKSRPAGVRTFMLVSVGAAAFSIIVLDIIETMPGGDRLQMDPVRIVEGIIGGIGFLGAGAIIHGQGQVTGITTGAGIWVAGAIGVACGFGQYQLSLILTLIAIFILYVVGAAQHRLFPGN